MPTCTLVGVKSTKVQVCAAYVPTMLSQYINQTLAATVLHLNTYGRQSMSTCCTLRMCCKVDHRPAHKFSPI